MPARVDRLLERMTLPQRVGQMLCLGFCGTVAHPDALGAIAQFHPGALRLRPHVRNLTPRIGHDQTLAARVRREPEAFEQQFNLDWPAPRLTAAEYARTLDHLRHHAVETGSGVPPCFALACEGDSCIDAFFPGMLPFPNPMGLAAAGDPTLCRRAAEVVARQLKLIGIDWLFGPVVEVNAHGEGDALGPRAYGADAPTVAAAAAAAIEGYDAGWLISTARHFPGGGHEAGRCGQGAAIVTEPIEWLADVHLPPFRRAVEAGAPAIMLAHAAYPALDPGGEPASFSRAIVTGLLREQLGFEGVVMTDSLTDAAALCRCEVAEAAVRAIEAGVDLLLIEEQTALRGEVFHAVLAAARTGRIAQERIAASARRMLAVKERYGVLDGAVRQGGEQLEASLREPAWAEFAAEAAARAIVLLRNRRHVLPLEPDQRLLVVEEPAPLAAQANDSRCHLGALYEALLSRGVRATFTDYQAQRLDEAWPRIRRLAGQADTVIVTGWHEPGGAVAAATCERFTTLQPPVVFITNSPYPPTVSDSMDTVVVTFSPAAVSMQAAADVLMGRREAGHLPFDPVPAR